jgi:hypothetical protein
MAETLRIDELPKLEADHVLALRAVVRGHATPAQQVTAIWVIQSLFCGVAALPPAKLSEREAGFLSGKSWVALAINTYADVPLYRASEQPVHAGEGKKD